MIATIKTPGEHFGHVDGAAAADSPTGESCADRAFDRRVDSSRLDECERADYERAYVEAFDTARALRHALAGWRVVEAGAPL